MRHTCINDRCILIISLECVGLTECDLAVLGLKAAVNAVCAGIKIIGFVWGGGGGGALTARVKFENSAAQRHAGWLNW